MPFNNNSKPLLIGSSAGSLISLAISAGVREEDCMNIVLNVAKASREQGGFVLDSLYPGFSLIDQVDKYLYDAVYQALQNGDEELFQRRITHQEPFSKSSNYNNDDALLKSKSSLLRIALTQKHIYIKESKLNPEKSYRYVDSFRSIKDACAASILSSFIPIGTGPLKGAKDETNTSVKHAWTLMKEMVDVGAVKDGLTDQAVNRSDFFNMSTENENDKDDKLDEEVYWDGGLSNMWPVVDESTLVVSILNGNFHPNPYISPQIKNENENNENKNNDSNNSFFSEISLNDRCQVGFNYQNLLAMKLCLRSTDESVYETEFKNGYQDANRFLKEHNLLRVFS